MNINDHNSDNPKPCWTSGGPRRLLDHRPLLSLSCCLATGIGWAEKTSCNHVTTLAGIPQGAKNCSKTYV